MGGDSENQERRVEERSNSSLRSLQCSAYLVLDDLLVHIVGVNSLHAMALPKSVNVRLLELLREVVNDFARVLTEDGHHA